MSIVIKQYGERRTGTNYLRALIQANWPEVLLLMYILGDKHRPPVDFEKFWLESQDTAEPAYEFASRATFIAPGPATQRHDLLQQSEIRKRAARVAAAYASHSLRFVVTVKDPTAWVASLARFEQWSHNGAPLASWDFERLESACRMYNEKYAAWRRFVLEDPAQRLLIRFEDLLHDAEAVLARLRDSFGLGHRSFVDIRENLEPTVWDHLPVNRSAAAFDRTYYFERRYLDLFSEEHRAMIARTIDWDLFGGFGYEPPC